MFWQRQCLNIFIKKGGRLVKGSHRVCGLTLICFDIPCSLIICRVLGITIIHMKCRAESNRPSTFACPQLHVSSRERPARSSKHRGNPSPARASLRDWVSLGAGGTLQQHRTDWAGTSRLPFLAPGQPQHFFPHLCKSSVYFYVFFPSCGSLHHLRIPFLFACARMSSLSFLPLALHVMLL